MKRFLTKSAMKTRMTVSGSESSYFKGNDITVMPFRMFRSFRLNIFLIFIFAFAVRYMFLQMFKDDLFFKNPLFDAEYYDKWAVSIANGNWLGERIFFASPLYAYFLAVLYKLFHHGFYWVILVQLFLGSVHCVLVYLTGRKIFGEIVGLIAAFLTSLYGFFLYLETQLLKNSLAYFLSTLSLYLFLLARERKKSYIWGLLGVSAGLTALVIPNVLVFVPILFISLIFDKAGRQRLFLNMAALFLGLFIVVAPVTLRNYLLEGDIVLISSNGGINLFLGTDPQTEGGLKISTTIQQAPDLEEQSSKAMAERSLQRHLKPSEISRFWTFKALTNIASDPPSSFRLLLKKIAVFWNWRERTDNLDFYYFREKYPILRVPFLQFGVVVPLSFVGIWLSRRQWKKTMPIVVVVVLFAASCLPFPIFDRYRVPVVPFLLIFAAFGIYTVFRLISQKQWKELAACLLLFLISFALINSGDRTHNFSFMHRSMGEIFIQKGDFRTAAAELEKAVASEPGNFYAHNSLGYSYLMLGLTSEAVRELRTAITLYPGFIEAHNTLGFAYSMSGNTEAAEEEYRVIRELNSRRLIP